jgi:ABC-2 type transport system permease protein
MIRVAEPRIESRLWSNVWKLLRIRMQISWNTFRRGKIGTKIGTVILYLVIFGIMAGVFFGSGALLDFIRSEEFTQLFGDAEQIIRIIPSVVITFATLFTFFTSFGVLLQALYLAGDMEFLLSTPVPIRAVFIAKLIQAILPNFGLTSLFVLPILFGLGISSGYNFLFYIFLIFILSALALAAASITSLVVMSIARLFSPRRIAEVLGAVVAIISLVCSQSGQLFRFADTNVNPSQAASMVNAFSRFNSPWSPLAWAGRGVLGLGEGNWLTGIGYTLLILVLSSGLFYGALVSAEKLYYTGWARVQGSWRRKKSPAKSFSAKKQPTTTWLEKRTPSPTRAIMVKDFLVLRRDLRNLSQILSPLIFGIIYAFVFTKTGKQIPSTTPEVPVFIDQMLKSSLSFTDIALSLFIGWSLASRLAGMAFSQENKSYWMLKSAPVSIRQLLAAKFFVAYIPTLIIGALFLGFFVVLQPAKLAGLPFSLLVYALSMVGLIGVSLAFGVSGAHFNWDDPRKMQSGSSGCLSALLSLVYFGFSLMLFLGPTLLFSALGLPLMYGQLLGLLLGGGLSVMGLIAPLKIVWNRVARLNEE